MWGGAPDADAIDLAFSEDRANERKAWLTDAKHRIALGSFDRPTNAASGAAAPTAAAVAADGADGAAADAGAPAPPPALAMAELRKMRKSDLQDLMAELGLSAVGGDGKRLPVAEMRKLLAGGAAAAATPTLASGACREDRTFSQLVHEELVHFSLADNRRSLPSLIDGLKPSQRKALHACFEKKLFAPAELKVQALASYTSETLDYKHGEAALIETIKKMAQATFTQPQPQPQPQP